MRVFKVLILVLICNNLNKLKLKYTNFTSTQHSIVSSSNINYVNKPIETNFDTNTFNINKTGYYLVQIEIAHCGASGIAQDGPGWLIHLRNSSGNVSYYGYTRDAWLVPAVKSWDSAIFGYNIYYLYANTSYYIRCSNQTGKTIDGTYGSTFKAKAFFLTN